MSMKLGSEISFTTSPLLTSPMSNSESNYATSGFFDQVHVVLA